jgi:hypothetical protein
VSYLSTIPAIVSSIFGLQTALYPVQQKFSRDDRERQFIDRVVA